MLLKFIEISLENLMQIICVFIINIYQLLRFMNKEKYFKLFKKIRHFFQETKKG